MVTVVLWTFYLNYLLCGRLGGIGQLSIISISCICNRLMKRKLLLVEVYFVCFKYEVSNWEFGSLKS